MSTNIHYKGEHLGRFKVDEYGKTYFVAENISCLEKLLSLNLNPEEELEVEGACNMSYSKFKETWLSNISGFYFSMQEFLFKNYKGRTPEEVGKETDARKNKK